MRETPSNSEWTAAPEEEDEDFAETNASDNARNFEVDEEDETQVSERKTVPERRKKNGAAKGEIYSLEAASDSEVVKKYRPKFLARGGEHLVYELPERYGESGRKEVVVKVELNAMERNLEYNLANGLKVDSMDPENLIKFNEYLEKKRRDRDELKHHFGSEHVLAQKEFLAKVPVTPRIMKELYGHNVHEKALVANELWSVVRIVRRNSDAGEGVESLEPRMGYVERSKYDPESYKRVMDRYVFGRETETFPEDSTIDGNNFPVADLLARAESDPGLREAMKDFTGKAVGYTEETGKILDLAGQGNVQFTNKDEVWSYKMIDALYPIAVKEGDPGIVELAVSGIKAAEEGRPLSGNETAALLNAVSYARVINMMADKLGIEGRVRICDPEQGYVDLRDVLRG